eukprot:467788-Rhodomonas_salina.1
MLAQHHVPTSVPLAYCSACLLATQTPGYVLQVASTSVGLPDVIKKCLPVKQDGNNSFSTRSGANRSPPSEGQSPVSSSG